MPARQRIVNSRSRSSTVNPRDRSSSHPDLPVLLTPDEVAASLRTSRKAVYATIERGHLPGIVRIGRRVLVREDALLDWLRQKSTPSPEG
jgi:excisionase family DNA binding protein